MSTRSIAIELDGVLATYDGWDGVEAIGEPIPHAATFLRLLRHSLDLELVIHTTRLSPDPFGNGEERRSVQELEALVRAWLEEHDIPHDRLWTGHGKPVAVAHVDDRAVTCRPQDARNVGREFYAALRHIQELL